MRGHWPDTFITDTFLNWHCIYLSTQNSKYLNVCPSKAQPGFDTWFANGGGTYYSPSFAVENNVMGLKDGMIHYNETDYSTSLIGNQSLGWIRKVLPPPTPSTYSLHLLPPPTPSTYSLHPLPPPTPSTYSLVHDGLT
jgi:hypothetical protein